MPARAPRASRSATRSPLAPRAPIRRFDVFAEFHRLQAMAEGMAADRAKGHGLWLAKIVAARKFGRGTEIEKKSHDSSTPAGKWHVLSGKPQTAALFDKEIVARMGAQFYRRVFAPAVRRAQADGKSYVMIRDSLRTTWKP